MLGNVGDELLEGGSERLGSLEEGDELDEGEFGCVVGGRREAVFFGVEGEGAKSDGGRNGGAGFSEDLYVERGVDDGDGEVGVAVGKEVGEGEERGDVPLSHEGEENYVFRLGFLHWRSLHCFSLLFTNLYVN